jgi:hypothetical protein
LGASSVADVAMSTRHRIRQLFEGMAVLRRQQDQSIIGARCGGESEQ